VGEGPKECALAVKGIWELARLPHHINSKVGNAADGSQARANAWNALSDERLKKNFKPIPDALEKIKAISGYFYEWKRGADKSRKVGVKAQEVQKVFPEVVSKGDDGFLSVSYDHLIAPIIEAVKSLSEIQTNNSRDISSKADKEDVELLKAENERLKKENEEIKIRLRKIEESLNLN